MSVALVFHQNNTIGRSGGGSERGQRLIELDPLHGRLSHGNQSEAERSVVDGHNAGTGAGKINISSTAATGGNAQQSLAQSCLRRRKVEGCRATASAGQRAAAGGAGQGKISGDGQREREGGRPGILYLHGLTFAGNGRDRDRRGKDDLRGRHAQIGVRSAAADGWLGQRLPGE